MAEFEMVRTSNLLLQIVILFLLLYGFRLFKMGLLRKHGIVNSVAAVLNTFSIFLFMIPSLIERSEEHLATDIRAITFTNWTHIILGSLAEALAVVLVLKLATHSLEVKRCGSRIFMKATLYTWVIALVSGIIMYFYHALA